MFNNDGQSQGGGSFGGDFEMSPNLYPYYKPMDEHKQEIYGGTNLDYAGLGQTPGNYLEFNLLCVKDLQYQGITPEFDQELNMENEIREENVQDDGGLELVKVSRIKSNRIQKDNKTKYDLVEIKGSGSYQEKAKGGQKSLAIASKTTNLSEKQKNQNQGYQQFLQQFGLEKQKKIKKQLSNRLIVVDLVPEIVLDRSFLIPGGIVVNTQFDSEYRNIWINSNIHLSSKSVVSVEFKKEKEVYETQIFTKRNCDQNFLHVIDILERFHQQQVYDQAQILKRFQGYVNSVKGTLERIRLSGIINDELFLKNELEANIQADRILAKIPNNAHLVYTFGRFNYKKSHFENTRVGVSASLCNLLGISEQDAVPFSQKLLIMCMMKPDTQINYFLKILEMEMKGNTKFDLDFFFYTLEGFPLLFHSKQEVIQFPGQFSEKDFTLRLAIMQPNSISLQKVEEERKISSLFNPLENYQTEQKKEYMKKYKVLESDLNKQKN